MTQILALDFMRNAFLTGGCVALAAGLVGYFVVLRNQVFTADALGHAAFTGGLGGLLLGWNLLAGVFASCIGVALGIGALGGRGRGRDVAIGTVFAWVLGVGVLFLSLYTTARSASSGSVGLSVLFGSILGLQPAQVVIGSLTGIATCVVTLLVARPLLFLSVDPDVAVARGLPVRLLTVVFLVLLAVTVAESVQAVGALLIFALMVTPPAVAQSLTARPWLGMALSAGIALGAVWLGLILTYYVPLPASFFITALAFAAYLVSRLRWRLVAPAALVLILVGCGLSESPVAGGSSGRVEVVAAESFWGSVAAQVGGDHAHVTSVISNPALDPHDYDATPADARLVAQARYVIVNGAGYDAWATKLAAAIPEPGRIVLTVGELVGKRQGDNPHLWYSPDYVDRVVGRIAADLAKLDPADAGYFAAQAERYRDVALKPYFDLIGSIKQRHSGTQVGATESMFVYLTAATGLDLVTPPGFMNAISAGIEPSPSDKAPFYTQIETREISVLLFNSQNTTPDVKGLVDKAKARGIAIVAMTETPVPASAAFQDWQTAQLRRLLEALGG